MRFLFCVLAIVVGCEKPAVDGEAADHETAEQVEEPPKGYIDRTNDNLRELKVDLNEQAGAREGKLDEKIGQSQ